jgi:hypothetical protein
MTLGSIPSTANKKKKKKKGERVGRREKELSKR